MSTHLQVTGFILAGGKSSRMGRDKALLDWHGQTLLDHMVNLLSAATDHVRVVGRGSLPDLPPSDRGPLSGVITALDASATDANLVVAVDLPLLTGDFLKYLRSQLERTSRRIVACKIGSNFPLCLGIRRGLLPELQRRLADGDFSVHRLIESIDAEVIPEAKLSEVGFDASIFRNINTAEDYRSIL
ncbi:MAG TPA: molybdenum cofactor guanylyltransferase [Terriglobia bacterium]|nr:molybdenum cofactor guanylyltransferase [Terriglobia bacterium]